MNPGTGKGGELQGWHTHGSGEGVQPVGKVWHFWYPSLTPSFAQCIASVWLFLSISLYNKPVSVSPATPWVLCIPANFPTWGGGEREIHSRTVTQKSGALGVWLVSEVEMVWRDWFLKPVETKLTPGSWCQNRVNSGTSGGIERLENGLLVSPNSVDMCA